MNENDLISTEGSETKQLEGAGKRSSRRTFIKTGIGVIGGLALSSVYTPPTLRSIPLASGLAQAYGGTNPPPSGGNYDDVLCDHQIHNVDDSGPDEKDIRGTVEVENDTVDHKDVRLDRASYDISYTENGIRRRVQDFDISFSSEPLVGSVVPTAPDNRKSYPYVVKVRGLPSDITEITHTVGVSVVRDQFEPPVFLVRTASWRR